MAHQIWVTDQQGCHRGNQPLVSGIFRLHLPCTQKSGNWRLVRDLNALSQYLLSPHFQMEMTASIMCSMTWTLSNFCRSVWCILSCTDHQKPQELSLLLVWTSPFSVPTASIWTSHFTLPIHSARQGSGHLCQDTRPFHTPVSRRLEYHGTDSACLHSLNVMAAETHGTSGFHSQFLQVRPSASDTVWLCGHNFQSGQQHSQARPASDPESAQLHPGVLIDQGTSCHQVATAARPHDITGETDGTGMST